MKRIGKMKLDMENLKKQIEKETEKNHHSGVNKIREFSYLLYDGFSGKASIREVNPGIA
jgi:hypothetical protein